MTDALASQGFCSAAAANIHCFEEQPPDFSSDGLDVAVAVSTTGTTATAETVAVASAVAIFVDEDTGDCAE